VTARTLIRHVIECNGLVAVVPALPWDAGEQPATAPCPVVFEPPAELAARNPPPAALRKAAARQGWRYVRSRYGRALDTDFCPRHPAAGQPPARG
jgi:hypothetical protein